MTIASEIDRINTAKSNIKQAIIDKGVDVPDTDKIDTYADCIANISTGSDVAIVDYTLVGGGGGGASGYASTFGGGGGGGGEVLIGTAPISGTVNIVIGAGGKYGNEAGSRSCRNKGFDGGDSYIGNIKAKGGTGGLTNDWIAGLGGNSGGGYVGGNPCWNSSGGGAGAGGTGCSATSCYAAGRGGDGICGMGGGGGGGGWNCYSSSGGAGVDGGGDGKGAPIGCGCHATYYGGGGGGAGGNNFGGCGYQGLALICYKTDGSCGITKAAGGVITECDGYTIHCFTSDGKFFLPTKYRNAEVFIVGGGGAGSYSSSKSSYGGSGGGGGGGEVICGEFDVSSPIIVSEVGAGGVGVCKSTTGNPGGNTCAMIGGQEYIARGGTGGTDCKGGTSGSGYVGKTSSNVYSAGGGGGAYGEGCCGSCCYGGSGGAGLKTGIPIDIMCALGCGGYGGSRCWGGNTDGVRYGEGGKGQYSPSSTTCYGSGKQGAVIVRYVTGGIWQINTSTGGDCCFECDGYCYHIFETPGEFTVTS